MNTDNRLQQYGQIYPADTQTPISLYMDLVGSDPGILLESAEVDGRLGRYSLIAWDFRVQLDCNQGILETEVKDPGLEFITHYNGRDFIPGLRELLQELYINPPENLQDLPALTRSLLGFFGYGLPSLSEPKLAKCLHNNDAQTTLVLPGKQILFDHLHHRCIFLGLDNGSTPEPRAKSTLQGEKSGFEIGEIVNTPEKKDFCNKVQRTRELIQAGEAIQVVLSTRFQAPFSGDPFQLYRRLRQTNPSPYMFYINLPSITLLGSSPELMVRCSGNKLQERPIAGTRPRGDTPAQDEEMAKELSRDPKERAEHVMLVDLGRNDLGRLATPGSVEVEKLMQVEKFSHVMHLTSYLKADLQDGLDSIDILLSTLPAGTVSGAPKIRAMEIIAEMEPLPRGPYAGAVGWLGTDQGTVNLDTGITIRSMWIRDGYVYWQAGAGIVNDSVPEKEWEECQNKSRVIKKILSQDGGSDVFANR
ncbi:MAG: anthranilate synthase component I family protein [Thermodesulfobacteriota bacterium]